MRYVKNFLIFLYDFFIGDDWRVALIVVIGLVVTAALAHNNATSWYVLPVAVALAVPYTLWRAVKTNGSKSAPS